MTTSGNYDFGVTTETFSVIDEAYERCMVDPSGLSVHDVEKAIRSLNMLSIEWSNRQLNLWTVELQVLPLELDKQYYTLDNATIAILQTVTRQVQSNDTLIDMSITGIGRGDYLNIPNKAQTANRPTQFYFDRQVPPKLYLWPVVDNEDTKLIYYRIRAMQTTVGMNGTFDAPQRLLDAIAAGLAYRLSMKGAGGDTAGLKMAYDEAFGLAAAEDRERVPTTITPDFSGTGWGG